jgi:hypothetical protein
MITPGYYWARESGAGEDGWMIVLVDAMKVARCIDNRAPFAPMSFWSDLGDLEWGPQIDGPPGEVTVRISTDQVDDRGALVGLEDAIRFAVRTWLLHRVRDDNMPRRIVSRLEVNF